MLVLLNLPVFCDLLGQSLVIRAILVLVNRYSRLKMVHPECAELTAIHAKPLVLQALIIEDFNLIAK